MTEEEKKFVEEFKQKFLSESTTDNSRLDEIYNAFGIDMEKLEEDMKTVTPEKLTMKYKILNPNAVRPSYNYEGDSGFDLYSTEEITLPPLGRALVGTGLSFDIPDTFEIQVRSKSGLAINQGIMCLNSPGTVDNGYTGEVQVIVFNTNNHTVTIPKGMKVGQAVLCPVVNGKWVDLAEKGTVSKKEIGRAHV